MLLGGDVNTQEHSYQRLIRLRSIQAMKQLISIIIMLKILLYLQKWDGMYSDYQSTGVEFS